MLQYVKATGNTVYVLIAAAASSILTLGCLIRDTKHAEQRNTSPTSMTVNPLIAICDNTRRARLPRRSFAARAHRRRRRRRRVGLRRRHANELIRLCAIVRLNSGCCY